MRVTLISSTILDGNMSVKKGDPHAALKNRNRFLSQHHLSEKRLIFMRLSHSTKVAHVTKKNLGQSVNADALITLDPSLTLYMLTGDCIPLAIVDPIQKNLALIHCSWDTLDKGILKKVINQFLIHNSSFENLHSYIGPSIGPCCYFQNDPQQKDDPKWKPFIKSVNKTYSIDLWRFTQQELINLGINKQNIENFKICTYHSGNYYSHHKFRKEKLEHDYRFATILKIN